MLPVKSAIPPEPEVVVEPIGEVDVEVVVSRPAEEVIHKMEIKDVEVKVVGKIDLDSMNQRTRPAKKTREQLEKDRRSRYAGQQKEPAETTVAGETVPEERPKLVKQPPEVIRARAEKLNGPKVVGKMALPGSAAETEEQAQKKKRTRITERYPAGER